MATRALNISRIIDERPFSRLQLMVVAFCGLINFFDGMDTQSIGVAAPFIAKSLGLAIPQLGPVFSAGLLGAVIGAIGFGAVADRFGRKRLLVLASLLIGVFTLLTALAGTFETLLLCRFLAGIGLGGATPCFISLTAEYTPNRYRASCVTLMWSSFPLGAMVGAFVNSRLIEHFGWQAIFFIGGLLPVFTTVALAIWLPESLRFLIIRKDDTAAAHRILRRMGVPALPAGMPMTTDGDETERASFGAVFRDGRTFGTFLLWVPMFAGFGILTLVVLWTPSLMGMNGVTPADAAFVVAFNGLGAFFGQAVAGRCIERFGVVPTMAPAFVLGAVATVGLGYSVASIPLASLSIGLIGLFLGIGTAGAIALAAEIYPTSIRATGVGLSMAAGRFGQVCAPYVVGQTLAAGVLPSQIMFGAGGAALVGGGFILLFKIWLSRRPSAPTLDAKAVS
ncbi:MFS transporter [Rhizobium sp. P28RR-XV]|uniref:MFS transporter n=1 Tax=Rhizobium sp. P28RR-XV TaxID=2726737 RepID=UPI001456AA9E|nr:MFS transporter [Rhizobium sp. P28RR-XV]NLR88444.1 MFS transporter [Rhizobium sp. P28RR-XV]